MASITVTDLRTRIDELSLAITRQREVLKDLENQKRTAQGDLNAILDPMSRLPSEISSDIMLLCLPTTVRPDPHAAPMIFLNICRSWSNIALCTPALWSAIQVDTKIGEGLGQLTDRWVARAAPRLLSLSLHGTLDSRTPGLLNFARRNLRKAQNLELYFPSASDLRKITGSGASLFPSLTRLTIGQGDRDGTIYEDEEHYSDDAHECVRMLSAAPNLVECTFYDVWFGGDHPPTSLVTHTSLRDLYLGGSPTGSFFETIDRESSAAILLYLTLPVLERLWITNLDISSDNLFDFLERSSPPLRYLYMDCNNEPGDAEHFLQLIPTVTDLYIWFNAFSENFVFSMMAALASGFLPNLRNLIIHGAQRRSPYEQVLSTLSARRASGSPLQSFKWWEWVHGGSELSPEIVTALRELVADGMDIHIGQEGHNLI
ncbi:hypothetical protein DFH07DRAFT_1063244 [Mycena maculata]|uniref:F-box domain-containing protein n=1 Tax=Mycena maculata TaxID=230809 RepID=A0AAD7N5G3_9AGAR|nr:hypothetical protein DFH07DRAFT_1063244 [Mycena maculata]